MNDKKKKWIYWGVYSILMAIGIVLSVFRILPVKNAVIFFFGLMWGWMGLSLLVKVNPYEIQKYGRKGQLGVEVAAIGLGVAWVVISCTELSQQALPMIYVSAPFIIIDTLIFLCNKRSGRKN